MTREPIVTTTLGTASFLLFAGALHAAEIRVLSTQATEQAYRELVPQFEKASGHKVTTVFTGTLDANKRLAAGETYDLLIMSAPSIEEHIKTGKVLASSRVDLAKSGVGVGVKAGAPKPDISTTEALKKTMLAAKSIGYSTGPSGVYMIGLFQHMGIADEIKHKLKQTPTGVFVGSIIASGEAEIGFQQVSELSHFAGVDYVGPLPADIQRFTTFSSGIIAGAKTADAA
ncbi:MAG TPA: substrate-binding domain-containing protein, partial [Xanthobacteraceae bacterium]|nr:substrate-binding domain-containing protein [Xanthobacteraceae bacterium]